MFSNTLNRLFGRELKGVLDRVLDETILLQIVKALHQVVFNEQQEEITEEVREFLKSVNFLAHNISCSLGIFYLLLNNVMILECS
jgi:hypothetical protein